MPAAWRLVGPAAVSRRLPGKRSKAKAPVLLIVQQPLRELARQPRGEVSGLAAYRCRSSQHGHSGSLCPMPRAGRASACAKTMAISELIALVLILRIAFMVVLVMRRGAWLLQLCPHR